MKIHPAGTNCDTLYEPKLMKKDLLETSFKITHQPTAKDGFDSNNKKQFSKHESQLKELKKQMIESLNNVKKNGGHMSRDLNMNWGLMQVS